MNGKEAFQSLMMVGAFVCGLYSQGPWSTAKPIEGLINAKDILETIKRNGPQGALNDRFEYMLRGDRLLSRHSSGPANEPFRETSLPGTAVKMAATNERVYVWVAGAVLEFSVGESGVEAQTAVLSERDPTALAALEPKTSVMAPAMRKVADILISPQRLLVANSGGGVTSTGVSGDSVTVIDASTNTVIRTVPFAAGDSPTFIAMTPDNSKAFIPNYGCLNCSHRGIAVFDPQSLNTTATISLGNSPLAVGVTADGNLVLVSDGSVLYAISTNPPYNVQGQIDVGTAIQDLALTSDGRTAYVLSSSRVSNIARLVAVTTSPLNQGGPSYTFPAGSRCFGVAVSADDSRIAATCIGDNPMTYIFDRNLGVVASTASTGSVGLAFSPDGKRLYVAHRAVPSVEILDPSTATRIKQIPLQSGATRIVIDKTGTRGYVSNEDSNTVTALDLVNDVALNSVAVGAQPDGLALTYAPQVTATPVQLNFNATAGGSNPSSQNFAMSIDTAGTFNWTATATTKTGGNWLSVSPGTGTFPATAVTVSVNVSGLAAGSYNGTVTITTPNAGNSPQISVALQVSAGGSLALSTQQLSFQSIVGGPAPVAQTVNITNSATGNLSWTAVGTDGNAPWLTLSPTSGTTPGTITVTVNPQGFPAGQLKATVSISSTNAGNSPQTFTVVYTLAAGPVIPAGGIVNAASFAQGVAVAPGALVSIFGSAFGVSSPLGASSLPLPTVLGNVKVTMGGVAAPLVFVSSSQINCQVPYELGGQSTVQVVVQSGSTASPPGIMTLAAAAPGIFTATLNGKTQGAILNKDRSLNTPANPAKTGEIVQIFATGPGPLLNTPKSGEAAPGSPLATTQTDPVVLIGGKPAAVAFSGLTPGLVGLWQINVVIPSDVTPGDAVTVQVQHGGVSSNTTTLAIAQ